MADYTNWIMVIVGVLIVLFAPNLANAVGFGSNTATIFWVIGAGVGLWGLWNMVKSKIT